MRGRKANLKNVVRTFRKGGPNHITEGNIIPGTIHFLPKLRWDNGEHTFDACTGSINRVEYDRMTKKEVKNLIHERYNNHYLLW